MGVGGLRLSRCFFVTGSKAACSSGAQSDLAAEAGVQHQAQRERVVESEDEGQRDSRGRDAGDAFGDIAEASVVELKSRRTGNLRFPLSASMGCRLVQRMDR